MTPTTPAQPSRSVKNSGWRCPATEDVDSNINNTFTFNASPNHTFTSNASPNHNYSKQDPSLDSPPPYKMSSSTENTNPTANANPVVDAPANGSVQPAQAAAAAAENVNSNAAFAYTHHGTSANYTCTRCTCTSAGCLCTSANCTCTSCTCILPFTFAILFLVALSFVYFGRS